MAILNEDLARGGAELAAVLLRKGERDWRGVGLFGLFVPHLGCCYGVLSSHTPKLLVAPCA